MPLIKCAECQRDVSDKAPACPHCGAPSRSAPPPIATTTEPPAKPRRKTSPVAWVALGLLIFGAIWWIQSGHARAYTNQYREANLPPMPVEVAYRQSLVGRGRVFVLKNTSDRQLSVIATLKNPTMNQERTVRVDLSPRGIREIGWGEGWVASSGDTVMLSHNEYKSYSARIP